MIMSMILLLIYPKIKKMRIWAPDPAFFKKNTWPLPWLHDQLAEPHFQQKSTGLSPFGGKDFCSESRHQVVGRMRLKKSI